MENQPYGKLAVNVYSGSGALPQANAVVRIAGGSDGNRDILYSLRTDIDGRTPHIELPAPDMNNSQNPDSRGENYYVYDIAVTLEGFYPKKISNVAVFQGVETILGVRMIPLPIFSLNSSAPLDNLNTVVKENRFLE